MIQELKWLFQGLNSTRVRVTFSGFDFSGELGSEAALLVYEGVQANPLGSKNTPKNCFIHIIYFFLQQCQNWATWT